MFGVRQCGIAITQQRHVNQLESQQAFGQVKSGLTTFRLEREVTSLLLIGVTFSVTPTALPSYASYIAARKVARDGRKGMLE